jgi:hypothetical protein
MPKLIGEYQEGNPSHPGVTEFQLETIPYLDGLDTESAELLKTLATEDQIYPGGQLIDLGAVGQLALSAFYPTTADNPEPFQCRFPIGRFYRVVYADGNRSSVPKFKVVREIIRYFAEIRPPSEFIDSEAHANGPDVVLNLVNGVTFICLYSPEPFANA